MSSGNSSIRCRIELEPAPRLARGLAVIPAIAFLLVVLAHADMLLSVSCLLASTASLQRTREMLMLEEDGSIRQIRFSETRGWQLKLQNGNDIRAQLVGAPRAFRRLCALEFKDADGVRFSCLAGFFNCSDEDLRSLNLLLNWSPHQELFAGLD